MALDYVRFIILFLYHLSPNERNSFADNVIYLVSLRRFLRAVINQSQNLRLSFQLSTNKKKEEEEVPYRVECLLHSR